jgi:hypothetical protein
MSELPKAKMSQAYDDSGLRWPCSMVPYRKIMSTVHDAKGSHVYSPGLYLVPRVYDITVDRFLGLCCLMVMMPQAK